MVTLKKKIIRSILLPLSYLLFFILFFFALYHEYKNQDDHVYYKVINLNSHKIYGISVDDKNNSEYKFLDNSDINVLFQLFNYETLSNIYRDHLETSKKNNNFCDVAKSKNCIYPTKDKNTCFISTLYNDKLKMSILQYEEEIQILFVSAEEYQEKFDICITQFLKYSNELIKKKIENLKKTNSDLKNFSFDIKFLDSNLSEFDIKNLYLDKNFKILLENTISIFFLNNMNYYLNQVDSKLLKTFKKSEKKTLIQNFKFSFLILILGIYFFILVYKKKLYFILKQ
jgi:hypothetical protein